MVSLNSRSALRVFCAMRSARQLDFELTRHAKGVEHAQRAARSDLSIFPC
jgi:hypothetical protein